MSDPNPIRTGLPPPADGAPDRPAAAAPDVQSKATQRAMEGGCVAGVLTAILVAALAVPPLVRLIADGGDPEGTATFRTVAALVFLPPACGFAFAVFSGMAALLWEVATKAGIKKPDVPDEAKARAGRAKGAAASEAGVRVPDAETPGSPDETFRRAEGDVLRPPGPPAR
jgi:hypothetical protein